MKDFTIEKYEKLIKAIRQNNIPVYGIKKWFQSKPKCGVLLRHDVDRKPANSLKAAEIENKYDVQSTFYFRITRGSFNEAIIKRIYELGHEIGYHYEDLSAAKGNYHRAIELFEKAVAQALLFFQPLQKVLIQLPQLAFFNPALTGGIMKHPMFFFQLIGGKNDRQGAKSTLFKKMVS